MPTNTNYKEISLEDWKQVVQAKAKNHKIDPKLLELRVSRALGPMVYKLVYVIPSRKGAHERYITIATCRDPKAMEEAISILTSSYEGKDDA